MRSKKQKEILQWLCRVEEIAAGNHVKTRLIDAVLDCKKDMERELTPETWAAKSQELDELLGQLKKQILCESEKEDLEDDVRQKAFEMLERCRRSNKILREDYTNSTDTYIQEAENSMKDLCNVEANYEEVTNKERFFNAMHNIGQKYKMQIDELQSKYIDVLHQNYQNTFDRLKSFFSSTDYGKETQRKFYEIYYENKDGLIRDAQGYAQKLEKGESGIMEYAEDVQVPIQKTVKRLKGKAARKKWMPVLVILFITVLGIGCKTALQQMNAAEQKEVVKQGEVVSQGDADSKTEENADLLEDIIDRAEKDTEKMNNVLSNLESITNNPIVKRIEGFIMSWVVPAFLLLLILYWLWIKSIDKQCRNEIIKETASLQSTALQEWKQKRILAAATEESFEMIEAYVDERHQELLGQLLNRQTETDPKGLEFAKLCSDWENIKRKVKF